jgi:hypothetical protein
VLVPWRRGASLNRCISGTYDRDAELRSMSSMFSMARSLSSWPRLSLRSCLSAFKCVPEKTAS